MRKRFVWSLLSVSALLGLTLMASEKPPAEFSDIMKSNNATNMALRMHVMSKDYDAVAKDAATFKGNFAKVEAFWTQRNVTDAIGFAKAAGKAATDLEAAAKAKDDAAIGTTTMALVAQCG